MNFGAGFPHIHELLYLVTLGGKEDQLQYLCSIGEHDVFCLRFHKYISYQWFFFLIIKASSGFIFVDAGPLFYRTMYQ